MKRVDPCETCANRPGCEAEFGETGCHYYPAWGSPAFDRESEHALTKETRNEGARRTGA